ncbi:hypothetical protein D3C85_1360200 [compost metagenome]
MTGVLGFGLGDLIDDLLNLLIADAARTPRARLIVQPIQPQTSKTQSPPRHGMHTDTETVGNGRTGFTLGTAENDLGTYSRISRPLALGNAAQQFGSL